MISLKEAINPPSVVKETIEHQYSAAQCSCAGYSFTGSTDYIWELGATYEISSTDVLRYLTTKGNHINVLDIGTGDEKFITNANKISSSITCYGISAIDMRTTKDPSDKHYIIGNANRLADIKFPDDIEFDCIFSKTTFMHLVDPIGAIVQAYDRLKIDGWLIIDEVPLFFQQALLNENILYTWAASMALVDALRKAGHILISTPKLSGLSYFIIKKTEKPLEFPLTYSLIFNQRTVYSIDTPAENIIEPLFNRGQEILTREIRDKEIIQWHLNSSSSYKNLLRGPTISVIDMCLTIMAYTNNRFKHISIKKLLVIINSLRREGHLVGTSLDLLLSSSTPMRIISILDAIKRTPCSEPPNGTFSHIDNSLQFAAMLDTIDLTLIAEVIENNNITFCRQNKIIEVWRDTITKAFNDPAPIRPHCDTIKRRLSV